MAKYKTIVDLAKGFKAGELEGWKFMLDNDNTSLWWWGDGPETFEFEDEKNRESKELWDSKMPSEVLDEALAALGIPSEGV